MADDPDRQHHPRVPAERLRCGLPLLILWSLQGAIDEGLITVAEAADLLRQVPETGATNG